MADQKISELTNITGANLADADEFVVVDTSADQTKAITFGELKTAFDTSTGFVRVTGDTMTGGLTVPTVDINGGTIDGTVIGGTTPAAGTFTALTSSGIDDNAASTAVTIDASGNVGIGTSSPSVALDVTGDAEISGSVTAGDATFNTSGTAGFSINSVNPAIKLTDTDTSESSRLWHSGSDLYLDNTGTGNTVFRNGATNVTRVTVKQSGDVAFRDDTGTTESFYWDASSERLGIGTTSPSATLDVVGNAEINGNLSVASASPTITISETDIPNSHRILAASGSLYIQAQDSDGTNDGDMHLTGYLSNDLNLLNIKAATTAINGNLTVDTTTLHVDSTNSWVGIGTTTPASPLEVVGSGQSVTLRGATSDATGGFDFRTSTDVQAAIIDVSGADGGIYLKADPTDSLASSNIRFDVDGSTVFNQDTDEVNIYGNIIIPQGDTTATDTRLLAVRSVGYAVLELSGDRGDSAGEAAGAGMTLGADGAGANALVSYVNGAGTDGIGGSYTDTGANTLLIGTLGSQDVLIGRNGAARLLLGSAGFRPVVDTSLSLGSSSFRWNVVYAATGSINTSDETTKQDIDVLSEAETRVAQACKGLMRKFRFIDAVEKKGDDARIHFGIIAQDLQAAFVSEGLDPSRYAMFCSDTWWEEDTVVPARDAVAEVLDDEGNVVTAGREAVPATTQRKVYETAEEATETATEVTRLGVRYSELLAFIIAAI